MQSDNIHQQLIENAIDFIKKSLEEFETNLKYSIIHFAIGVELILKARLMNEHWSLTLENIDRISFQNFLDGAPKRYPRINWLNASMDYLKNQK